VVTVGDLARLRCHSCLALNDRYVRWRVNSFLVLKSVCIVSLLHTARDIISGGRDHNIRLVLAGLISSLRPPSHLLSTSRVLFSVFP